MSELEAERLLAEVERRRAAIGERLLPPPPGYSRDVITGREWRTTESELRECNRVFAKHRYLEQHEAGENRQEGARP